MRTLPALLLMTATLLAQENLRERYNELKEDPQRAEERRAVLQKIIESNAQRALYVIAQHARHNEDAHAAACALCRRGDLVWVQRLVEAADRFERLARSLFFALPLAKHAELGPWLVPRLEPKKKPVLRLALIRAVGEFCTAEALEPLSKTARSQLKKRRKRDRELLYEVVYALGRIGGADEILQKCAQDKDWRARLAAAPYLPHLKSDPHPNVRAAAGGDAGPGPVLFVVDVSAAMGWPSTHPNRIEVAQREVSQLIKAVRTPFNVATFAGLPWRWAETPVPPTAKAKQTAVSWLDRFVPVRPRGATNLYWGLTWGLDHCHTMHVFAGGPPNTGAYEDPTEILLAVLMANRSRHVTFHGHAVTFGSPRAAPTAWLLRELASQTGGTFREIKRPY